MPLKYDSYPTCCGAAIIHRFSYQPITKTDEKEFVTLLKSYGVNGKCMVTCIVNTPQNEIWRPVFLKHGFRSVATADNYRYRMHLYVKTTKKDSDGMTYVG